jgi:hypothetical protein
MTAPVNVALSNLPQNSETPEATSRLIFLLQLAYSGELGAAVAYFGHAHSIRGTTEAREVWRIAREEVMHRRCILKLLAVLHAIPQARREKKLRIIGWCISVFCHIGGWFFPMYGAAKLEAQNIGEYEEAAKLALLAGRLDFVEPILEMAEIEWDHELYFREQAQTHWLWRFMPKWKIPAPRIEIREKFEAFSRSTTRVMPVVRAPWFIR